MQQKLSTTILQIKINNIQIIIKYFSYDSMIFELLDLKSLTKDTILMAVLHLLLLLAVVLNVKAMSRKQNRYFFSTDIILFLH